MSNNKKKEDVDYFVEIAENVPVRKNLLESSRQIIHSLQDFERIKDLRREKKELVNELDSTFKEIIELSTKLKSALPKVPSKKKEPVHKPSPSKKKAAPKKKAPVEHKTELDKLEAQLKDVEKELDNIS